MKNDPRRDFVIAVLLIIWVIFILTLMMLNTPAAGH